MPRLSLALLGQFDAILDGCRLTEFETVKVRALLAYLVVEASCPHPREALATLLWPDVPAEGARTYLRQALANLRAALRDRSATPAFLVITRDTIQFNMSSDHWLDIATFTALLATYTRHAHRHPMLCARCAQRLEDAVALYGGPLLNQFSLGDSAAFEEWVMLKRQALHQQALSALTRLAHYHERRGAYDDVRRVAWRQIELDPWREEAHQHLMRALWYCGERSAALAQYERCRQMLRMELGVEPAAETTALYNDIRSAAVKASDDHPAAHLLYTLPADTTPLIGREEELARLADLLASPACRLLTLVGPGGIGKTRVAMQLAREHHAAFAHGVAFVPLARLQRAAQIVPAIAQTLQLTLQSREDRQVQLLTHLREQELLLVLDNFEHLMSAAPFITELLQVAPKLKVLVTSREVLRLSGEYEFPLPPLRLPALQRQVSVEQIEDAAAVQLFLARARAVVPAWTLTETTAPTVAAICHRLDGIPLAIELAAPRVKLLAPQALLTRLEHRLDLLTGGRRDLHWRQQTLRTTIDWSYNLLDPAEQQLFARLAIFAGGATLDAVEATCAPASPSSSPPIIDLLQSLVNKSLLHVTEPNDGQRRFTMLETIREYALERLAMSSEAAALARRHAIFFTSLVEAVEPALEGAQQRVVLTRLEAEYDNVRAALEWSATAAHFSEGDRPLCLRLPAGLAVFWKLRGDLTEGRYWLERMLEVSGGAETPLAAKALCWVGEFAWMQADTTQAAVRLEESIGLARRLGEWRVAAQAMATLGLVYHQVGTMDRAAALFDESIAIERRRGDRSDLARCLLRSAWAAIQQRHFSRATTLIAESLGLYRELGDSAGITWALLELGLAAQEQDQQDQAVLLMQETLRLGRELGYKYVIALATSCLGAIAYRKEDYAGARAWLEQALAQHEQLGAGADMAWAYGRLARVAHAQGDYTRAFELVYQAFTHMREVNEIRGVAWCLEERAGLAASTRQPTRAAKLLGIAQRLRETLVFPHSEAELPDYERYVSHTRSQLDEPTLETLWAKGREMSLEQAVAYALEEVPDASRR